MAGAGSTDPRLALPRLMRSIANEESASLLNLMSSGKNPRREQIPHALTVLDRLWLDFQQLARGSDHHDVLEVLEMVATTIQTETPQDVGQTAYVHLLQHLPRHVLREVAFEILKTHSYRTLPLPSEFLNSHTVKVWEDTLRWFDVTMRANKQKLRKLLDSPA